MKILVCIKQVPGSTNVEVDEQTGVLKRDSKDAKMNPFDLFALEMALEFAEKHGAKVQTLTMGPPSARAIIEESICMGVEGGAVLSDRKFGGADVLATAYTISQGIKMLGDFDIIFCGKQTTDGDTAQVGAELAEYLELPNLNNVFALELAPNKKLIAKTVLDNLVVEQEISTPCLICTEADINSPRLPSYKIRKSLTQDSVKFYCFEDFKDQNESHYGLNGSATQVERIFPPNDSSEKILIEGSAEKQSESVFSILDEKKFF